MRACATTSAPPSPRILTTPFADDRRVVSDDHSHGSQTSSVVPWPGGLWMRNVPFKRPDAILQAGDPRPGGRVGAPDPVVADADGQTAVASLDVDVDPRRPCAAGHVRQAFGDNVVRGHLGRQRDMPIEVHAQLDRYRRPAGERRESWLEPGLGKDGRVDAARQLPELVDRVAQLRDRLVELAREAIRSDPLHLSGILETDRDPGQVLLRPVMQRPLDASALRVTRGDQPCPRRAQLGQLGGQQVGELAVLDVCRQGRVDLLWRVASGEPRRDRRKRPAFRAEAQRPKQEGERDNGPSDGSEPVREPADRLGNVQHRRAERGGPRGVGRLHRREEHGHHGCDHHRPDDGARQRVTPREPANREHGYRDHRRQDGDAGPQLDELERRGAFEEGERVRRSLPESGIGPRGVQEEEAARTAKQERGEENGHRHAACPVEGDRGERQGQEGEGDVVVALEGEPEDPHRFEPCGPVAAERPERSREDEDRPRS